jgi:hypothetical protein
MTKSILYGVVSDTYYDCFASCNVIKMLNSHGIDKLVLNGNLFHNDDDNNISNSNFGKILDTAGRTGLEVYVTPGSTENFEIYENSLKKCIRKYPNVKDKLKSKYEVCNNHDLFFVSGANSSSWGGQFLFSVRDEGNKSGFFIKNDKFFLPLYSRKDFHRIKKHSPEIELFYINNLSDIKKSIYNSKNPIVFGSFPPKFEGPDVIDYFILGVDSRGKMCSAYEVLDEIKKRYGEMPMSKQIEAAKYEFNVSLMEKNIGSKILRDFYDENNLKKVISGNYTEISGIGTDSYGKYIDQNIWTDELFWSPPPASNNSAGILEVKGNKVRYKNLCFGDMSDFN